MTAFTNSLEAALFGRYPVASPWQWICDTLDDARARHETRKGYHHLLDNEATRRDLGVSAADVRRAMRAARHR